jgi:hypothetical protein
MFKTSEITKDIDAAILTFQGHVESVKRDKVNPHFRNSYATLENVIDTARPALQECGITFMQFPGAVIDGCLEVSTRLAHPKSGQWILATMQIPLGKRDPQGTGSAQTYAMRYSLMAALGLPPTDDDDGNAAMPAPKQTTRPNGTKSSAQIKREADLPDGWNNFVREIGEAGTISALDKLRLEWSRIAVKDGWNATVMDAAKEVVEQQREYILNGVDRTSNLHMAG